MEFCVTKVNFCVIRQNLQRKGKVEDGIRIKKVQNDLLFNVRVG